jgi:hypothetical protein
LRRACASGRRLHLRGTERRALVCPEGGHDRRQLMPVGIEPRGGNLHGIEAMNGRPLAAVAAASGCGLW